MPEPSVIRNLAATASVLVMPVAVAWIIGPTTIDEPNPDYAVRPPHIPVTLERLLGIGSVVIVLGAAVALAWSWSAEPPRPGWITVVAPLVVVGVILGVASRVITAPVVGANIGAGIMVLFGAPIVATLLLFAYVSAWRRRGRANVQHVVDARSTGSPVTMHGRVRSSGLLGKSLDVGTEGCLSVVGRSVSWTELGVRKWTADAADIDIERVPTVINHDLVILLNGDRWPLIIDDRRIRTLERGLLIARRRRDAATAMLHVIEAAKKRP